MTTPVLTAALTRLRADFDAAFPARDRASDGWIGDAAHQAEVSGHNPDDTAGVTAEYADADTKPEVRAIDVDADLRTPGVTMYDVIRRILATPADLARLRYIIFCPPSGPFGANVPTIWSKSNGWAPRRYTGASPHNEHAHFSGDPLSDEDASPWSVNGFGDDDMTPAEGYVQHVMNYRIDALLHMRPVCKVPAYSNGTYTKAAFEETNDLAVALGKLAAKAGLTPEEIQALAGEVAAEVVEKVDVPTAAENAEAVADELHDRTAD